MACFWLSADGQECLSAAMETPSPILERVSSLDPSRLVLEGHQTRNRSLPLILFLYARRIR